MHSKGLMTKFAWMVRQGMVRLTDILHREGPRMNLKTALHVSNIY